MGFKSKISVVKNVPQDAAAARMLDLPNATDTQVREAVGPGFPKHPLDKVVCIGGIGHAANLRAGAWTRSVRPTSGSAQLHRKRASSAQPPSTS